MKHKYEPQYTDLLLQAGNGIKSILRAKEQSTLPVLHFLLLPKCSLSFQLILTISI